MLNFINNSGTNNPPSGAIPILIAAAELSEFIPPLVLS